MEKCLLDIPGAEVESTISEVQSTLPNSTGSNNFLKISLVSVLFFYLHKVT